MQKLKHNLLKIILASCAVILFLPGFASADFPPNPHYGHYASAGYDNITGILDLIGSNPNFAGVRKYYKWKDIETSEGAYDFSAIVSDLVAVQAKNKRLWIFLTHTQYNGAGSPYVPTYILNDSKYGGVSPYYGTYRKTTNTGHIVPIFWNAEIQARFAALFTALGNRFNGEAYIEGMTLDETAVGAPENYGLGYTVAGVLAGFKSNALAAKAAFPDKTVIQQINCAMWDLTDFSAWCVSNDIGIGIPNYCMNNHEDLVYLNIHPLLLQYHNNVPTGPDVQWHDYEKWNPETSAYFTPLELIVSAIERTNPWYFFWVNREPYFTDGVIPAVNANPVLPSGCLEDWSCTAWSIWLECIDSQQSRTRTCTDQNNCGTTINKPAETETQSCESPPAYGISNFIQLVTDWLKSEPPDLTSDVNNDGVVNTRDLGIMMSNWE